MKTVDVFWSFRSPYSYLATKRLRGLQNKWEARIRPRPVYPIAIRTPDFFANAPDQWVGYLLKDIFRLSQYLQIPIGSLQPDPVVQDMATRAIAPEQPHIHRLTRLGILACEAGDEAGWAFMDEVSHVIWSGQPWTTGTVLADAVARAGLDLAALDDRQDAEKDRLEAAIEDNQTAQNEGGHWGVPLMVFEGEPFFGQDRIDLLEWRLEEAGVAKKA
jgi:2-hydroxychromene-2-carboxylate isomerase